MDWKTLLQIAAYVFPCIGFVLFFVTTHKSVQKWKARDAGDGITYGELKKLGGMIGQMLEKERRQVFGEGSLVIAGAVCGIISLFI